MGGLIYLVGLICGIWVIYDVWVKNRTMDDNSKILWTILAVIANVFTAVIYYMMHKRRA